MHLRSVTTDDLGALVDLWFESWRSVGLSTPIVTKADLLNRLPRDLAERWTVTVATVEGRLAGFLALSLAEDRLDQLFVAPEAQGTGVGSALFAAAVARMPGGFWLTTQDGNHRARAFYERRGMRLDPSRPEAVGGRLVYVWSPSGRGQDKMRRADPDTDARRERPWRSPRPRSV